MATLSTMSSLHLAMIAHGVPEEDTAFLAERLGIQSLEDIASVNFQRVLAKVPRARGDLRYAFVDMHNAYVPDKPWNVVHTGDCHHIEIVFAAQLLEMFAHQIASQ